jgi:hypothetical protein
VTLRLRDGVSLAEMEHGLALLDEDSGRYWSLNPTGALVLQRLLGGGTPDQAAEALTKEYEVGAETASQDVHDLLAELRSAGLIEVRR